LGGRRVPKVGASAVQPIAVDVVNTDTWRCRANHLVEEDRRFPFGVKEPVRFAMQLPAMGEYAFSVDGVDDRDAAARERDFDAASGRCRLGATLLIHSASLLISSGVALFLRWFALHETTTTLPRT